MTLQAHTFVLQDLHGNPVGFALVCPDVRYASVLFANAERLDRIHAPVALWHEVARELEIGLPIDRALDRISGFVRLLVSVDQRGSVLVRRQAELPVEAEVHTAAPALDAVLRGLAAKPVLSLKQSS